MVVLAGSEDMGWAPAGSAPNRQTHCHRCRGPFADDCRRILADIEEAETAATGTNAAPRDTLTLTAPVLFGHLHVTPILVDCLQRFSEVDAQCLFPDRVVNVVEEGIDVAVRIGELPDSSLQATRVGRVRRVLVAAPAYLKARDAKGARFHRSGGADLAYGSGVELKTGRVLPRTAMRSSCGGWWRWCHGPFRSQLTSTGLLRSCADDPKKAGAKVSRCFRRLHAYGLIAKIPRTRRRRASRCGRNLMRTSLYPREHHFPNVYSGVVF